MILLAIEIQSIVEDAALNYHMLEIVNKKAHSDRELQQQMRMITLGFSIATGVNYSDAAQCFETVGFDQPASWIEWIQAHRAELCEKISLKTDPLTPGEQFFLESCKT